MAIITIFATCIALVFAYTHFSTKKELTRTERSLVRLEERIDNYELFLETIEQRRERCIDTAENLAGSYGSYQYCVSFLKWLDENPYYLGVEVI